METAAMLICTYSGPAEQFLKCGGRTHLFNWGEGLSPKMVKGTVINLDFFQRGRPAVTDHFRPVKLLFIFGSVLYSIYYFFFYHKSGGAPPPARCLLIDTPFLIRWADVFDETHFFPSSLSEKRKWKMRKK